MSNNERRRYEKEIRRCTEKIKRNSNDFISYYSRGVNYYYLKKYQNAIEDYTYVIKIKPDYCDAYCGRGIVYNCLKQYENAIDDYTYVIKIKPDYCDAYYNRGVVYKDLKQYKNAIDDYNSVIKIKPDFYEAYCGRGLVYDDLKQHKNAIDDYNYAIKIKPDYYLAYYNRGVVYNALKQHKNAIDDYISVIKIKPDYHLAYLNRGVVYNALKQFQNAIDDFTSAIKMKPDFQQAYSNRGVVFRHLKDYKTAIKDFKKADNLLPNHALYNQHLGVCYREMNLCEKALQCFHKTLEIDNNMASAFFNRGIVYEDMKKYGKASSNIIVDVQNEKNKFLTDYFQKNDEINDVNIVLKETESIFETEVQNLKDPPSKQKTITTIEYTKLEILGKGGFGNVFKAMDNSSGKIIAVKEIAKGGNSKISILSLNEKNLMLNLNHPNVIDILGFKEMNDSFIIITSYAGEGTILDFFNNTFRTNVKAKCVAAKIYFKQIIKGLKYLHDNKVFHRDIKPSNILVDRGIVKIADFGTSRRFDNNTFTCVTSMGTAAYYSPEFMQSEVMDNIKISPVAVDIWALGITFIETLTGKYPFPTTGNLRKLIWNLKESPKIPDEIEDKTLRQIIQSCLIIDPTKRAVTDSLLNLL